MREIGLANREHGAVFTRRWVVELMLDSCGYMESADLGSLVAVEPSCGDGAFLLPMVERLSRSLQLHGRSLDDASGAIHAYDLQRSHVDQCRKRVQELLVHEGWPAEQVPSVVNTWVREADYLLKDSDISADFVIGNPPYIRSEDMSRELREQYMARSSCMTIGADIFVGFIEVGLRSLAPDGVLAFIVADRWMHNAYGRKLRRLVTESFGVETVIEMHGVNAFADEVSAYPAIIEIRRSEQGPVMYATAQPTFGEEAAARLVEWRRSEPDVGTAFGSDRDFRVAVLPDWFHTDDVWPSASPARIDLLEHLAARFRPLEDVETGTRVGIGIATGADAVFIVCGDYPAIEEDRLMPVVTTKHIVSGEVEWSGDQLVNPWNSDGQLVRLDNYPKLAAYLEPFRERLSGRHTAKKAPHSGWYRTIDKVHPGLAERQKLLLQDMKATIEPVLDEGGYYPHHNLYWITSDRWDLKVLGGILLSRVAQMFVEAYGVKMRGGTLRFQAQYLRKIRVPDPSMIASDIQSQLAKAFAMRDPEAATQAALAAYGLEELPD